MRNIKRHSARKDLQYFALPGLLIFSAGIFVSFLFGRDSLAITLINIITGEASVISFEFHNFAGLVMIVSGFGMAIIAQITLGRYYSSTLVIRQDHLLITHGVYRYVRHPIYLGVILASLGIAVFSFSLPGVLIMLGLIPVFIVRIRLEEALLMDEFGQEYREYQMATRKLLPFIY